MSGLELFGHRSATCTQRVLFTAYELDAPFKFNKVDFSTAQHKSPDFLKRQPFGKVPAAEWDGQPFYESRAISRILAEAHQDKKALLPRDLRQKAVFEQWASLESNTYAPQLDVVLYELAFKLWRGGSTDQAAVDAAMERLKPALAILETQLGAQDFVAGDFSLVDVFLAPGFEVLQGTAAGKEILAKYPNIAAWWNRVSQRPAWQRVLAEKAL